jgi:hypothetical protein
VEPEQERGDDAEVAAAAAQGPEEIGVFRFAGGDEAAVRQHQIGLEQIVDGQPELAGEVPDAAAQGETADPGRRDDAAGRNQPEGVGGVVDVAPRSRPLRLVPFAPPGRRGPRSFAKDRSPARR